MAYRQTVAAIVGGLTIAITAIVGFEGYIGDSDGLADYKDVRGIPTACFGHTATAEIGKVRTVSECTALLASDVAAYQSQILAVINVAISEQEIAAYTSLAYNVGVANFKRSTLLKKLNDGHRVAACAELSRWNKVRHNGELVVSHGLTIRRAEEKKLCLQGATKGDK